jgi:23S rRNA pseudouridine2457 synthase
MQRAKTILFYKPDLVLSTFTDEGGRETLQNYIPFKGIYSAGRLDYDSEGLLIITADGGLIHRLTDPVQHVDKTYLAMVEGDADPAKVHLLEKGIQLKEFRTQPCQAMIVAEPALEPRRRPVTPHGSTFWIRIQLREGKKHQVRHMTAAIGYPCLRLVRVAIGPLGLGNLQPGQWRELTEQEMNLLKGGKG